MNEREFRARKTLSGGHGRAGPGEPAQLNASPIFRRMASEFQQRLSKGAAGVAGSREAAPL